MRTRALRGLVLVAVLGAGVGCNAVLGIEALEAEERAGADGGGVGGDAGTDVDATTDDGATTDASNEDGAPEVDAAEGGEGLEAGDESVETDGGDDASPDASFDGADDGPDGADGDAPDAPSDEGGVDALADACGADTTSDPANCGSCGHVCPAPSGSTVRCVAGRCGYTADASDVPGFWSISPPDGPFQHMAVDDSDRILLHLPGTTSRWLDTTTKTTTAVVATGGPSSIVLGPGNADRYFIGGYENSYVQKFDGERIFTWNYGCCNVNFLSWAIDAAGMKAWLAGHYGAIAKWDLVSGTITEPIPNSGNTNGLRTYLDDEATAYSVAPAGVARWNLATSAVSWDTPIPNINSWGVAAIAADRSVLIGTPQPSPSLPGALRRIDMSGVVSWSLTTIAVATSPIVAPNGTVIVGLHKLDAAPAGVNAYDSASGALVWSATTMADVSEILLGDRGIVWVATQDGASSKLLGLAADSGALLYELRALPPPGEIILLKGVIYWLSNAVYAIPVESIRYEPNSAWPVKQHDNQRTSNRVAPLDH